MVTTSARATAVALASLTIGLGLLAGVARAGTPCAADIEKFCRDVPVGAGRIQACLGKHEKELSPACAARHTRLEQEMGTLAATCRFDISRFCWDVPPGGGRVVRCLDEHRDDLSAACRDQLGKPERPPAR